MRCTMVVREHLSSLLLLLGVLLVDGRQSIYGAKSKVINLKATNFDKKVLQDPAVWVVKFYAPW